MAANVFDNCMLLTPFRNETAAVSNINHETSLLPTADCANQIWKNHLCPGRSYLVMQGIITLINRIFGTPDYCHNAKFNRRLRWGEVQMQSVNEIDL